MHNKPPPPRGVTNPPNDAVFSSLLQPYNTRIPPPPFTLTSLLHSSLSWLQNRRIRFLFFLLCSPLLLVFLLLTFPFLCVTEICLRRRLWRKIVNRFTGDDAGDRLRRCEEGCCFDEETQEKGLLHRYLEDQLFLVRSMYECGEDEEFDEENLGSNEIPLLR